MSWLQRVFLLMSHSGLQPEPALSGYGMSLITSTYSEQNFSASTNKPLRMPSPEYRGLTGEYDPQGLAKRVAQAFDRHPTMRHVDTLCILQQGNQISLLGKIADDQLLQQVIELAKQVEGTATVDVSQVVVESRAG